MDDNSEPKASRARAAGRVLLRLVLPIQAMRETVSLAKRDAMRSKTNLALISELGAQAKRALGGRNATPQGAALDAPPDASQEPRLEQAQEATSARAGRDDSFAHAMARRGQGAPSIAELRHRFLLKKRTAIAADLVFTLLAIAQMVGAALTGGRHSAIVLAILSLVGAQSLCFVNALAAQLRIWQLDTRRLSRAEQGGLRDFVREVPRWWLQTLNPELSRHTKEVS